MENNRLANVHGAVKAIIIISGVAFIILLWPMVSISIGFKFFLFLMFGVFIISAPLYVAEFLLNKFNKLSVGKVCAIIIAMFLIIPALIDSIYLIKHDTVVQSVPDDGKIKLQVTLNKNLLHNNSVGNDWFFDIKVNGSKFAYNEKEKNMIVDYNTNIETNAIVVESDKVSDEGRASLDIPVSNINFSTGSSYTLPVTVVENHGRYSGNSAEWEIVFTFKRIIEFWDIVLG